MNMADRLRAKCDEVADMLVDKNRKYGNSALNPVRVFSRANATEQIRVRMDDKISRLKSSQLDDDEDVLKDLMGYIILLMVCQDLEEENDPDVPLTSALRPEDEYSKAEEVDIMVFGSDVSVPYHVAQNFEKRLLKNG